ncbi:hypothetical protein MMC22_011152 [Lobaria immixta]|nr:hypothetical protein [Lobaria immixta]
MAEAGKWQGRWNECPKTVIVTSTARRETRFIHANAAKAKVVGNSNACGKHMFCAIDSTLQSSSLRLAVVFWHSQTVKHVIRHCSLQSILEAAETTGYGTLVTNSKRPDRSHQVVDEIGSAVSIVAGCPTLLPMAEALLAGIVHANRLNETARYILRILCGRQRVSTSPGLL